MKYDDKWHRILLKNPFAWLEAAGFGFSAVAYFNGQREVGIIVLLIVLAVVSAVCFVYYHKAHARKHLISRFLRCPEKLHGILHHARDELSTRKLASRSRDASDWIEITRGVLQGLETCFEEITGADCHASIMLRDPANPDGAIKTAIRSSPVSPRGNIETSLLIGKGLAGKAFEFKRAIWARDFSKEKDFLPIREDYQEYYKSGISAPFKVNGEILGVVNLDCQTTFKFNEKYSYFVRGMADFIGMIYQIQQSK